MPAWSLSFDTSNCEPCPNSFSVPFCPTPHTARELEVVPCRPAQAKEEKLLPHLAAGSNMFPLTEGCEKWSAYTPGWIPSSSSSPKGNEGVWSNSTLSHPTPAPSDGKKRRSKPRVAKPKPSTGVFGRKHSQGPQRENILKFCMGPVFCTWNRLWHHWSIPQDTGLGCWGKLYSCGCVFPTTIKTTNTGTLMYFVWCGHLKNWFEFFFPFFFSPQKPQKRQLWVTANLKNNPTLLNKLSVPQDIPLQNIVFQPLLIAYFVIYFI